MEPKEKNEYKTSVLLDLVGIGIFAVILIYDLLKGKEFIGTAVISLYNHKDVYRFLEDEEREWKVSIFQSGSAFFSMC